ncbi:MAG TPA: type II toxin-antitoxin system death-on-curing family toxin [Stellaceae bacterium]|jgi:death-on-curing protein|nr:type II toxin-antitoxin system death-on-curing family toxin [Stellaceae bacterium]
MGYTWVDSDVVLAIHEEQLAEHGGADGVRDMGLLESALARPQNLLAYGSPDVADLAAAYAAGIARNHPFIDGNKRTAWVVAETFVELNGSEIAADDAGAYEVMLSLAEGRIDESAFGAWMRPQIKPQRV